jgi:hypothetical protein
VSPPRAVLILCSVLALSACGSSSKTSQPADTQPAAKAPPAIEAIDEPPAMDLELPSEELCLEKRSGKNCPTPDEAEKLTRAAQATEPAEGTKPRAIALLRLTARGPNDRARLVAWRSRSGKLCTGTEIHEGDTGTDQGPSGPCVPARCSKLCLDLMASGPGTTTRYLLSGVVNSKADELRAEFADGRIVPYGLTGPLVPGFPGYRVFMLDLGTDLYRRLELRLSDKDLAEETLSSAQIELICQDQVPPALPGQEGTSRSAKLHQCLQRAAPK